MLGKLFKREKSEEAPPLETEELTELPVDYSERKERLAIVIERLDDFTDTDRIIRKARSGQVVFVSIRGLRDKSMDELKHAISKFKTSVSVFNGDIVGVGDEFVILTPAGARIHRNED